MHELALCESIIKTIGKVLIERDIDKNQVIKVNITMGVLAGVDQPSFEFWFPIIAKEMHYADLILDIDSQLAYGHCLGCQIKYSMQTLMDPCPECFSFERDILSGMEFNIKSIEV